jgi:hypothetical protein
MADRPAPSEIPVLVTPREIERILGAVRARLVPADLDRDRLAADLSRAVFGYEARRLFQRPPSEEAVRARLGRIEEAIGILYKELPTNRSRLDWELLNVLDNEEGASHGSVAGFIDHLRWLTGVVTRRREQAKVVITPRAREPWGAEYWLFGEALPPIFERHFRRKAGGSRATSGGAPAGPYIRFALAVADLSVRKSTGRPYGAETITKALYNYRKLGKAERDIS